MENRRSPAFYLPSSCMIASVASRGRRSFLRQVSGLKGAGAAGQIAVRPPERHGLGQRAANALLLREIAARIQSERPEASTATNGDEALYPSLIGTYGRGFCIPNYAKCR